MTRTPNRDRALRTLAKLQDAASVPVGRLKGTAFHLKLSGRILHPGERGAGIDADAVVAGLNSNRTATCVHVEIESEGGSLRAANRIYAALRDHRGHIVVNANRLCASAATIILMAGDFRTCDAGTKFLLHEAEISKAAGVRWTAGTHARAAAILRASSAALIKTYATRTGRDAAIFKREIQNENCTDVAGARKLGLVHCLAGQERWIHGRPYYFPDRECGALAHAVTAMSAVELQNVVQKQPTLWKDTAIGHLAFATRQSG